MKLPRPGQYILRGTTTTLTEGRDDMATGQLTGVVRYLRGAARLHKDEDRTEGELLACFVAARDEAAFASIVRRHGPMVLGVCRRILGQLQDAEDAFQATFLILVRKAASIQTSGLLGNWLYGVAYRTALKARGIAAHRRAREKTM